MHELERIERALVEKDLDPALFEQCAQDLLTETYPGLSPVPGGTDWGRDADLHVGSDIPHRLMVTKSRDYSDIRSNMISGLESLKQHSVPYDRVIVANPGKLSETQRSQLRKEAAARGARLDAVYDRGFFASRLRRDGEWRKKLLGLSADPITVSRVPWRLAESPWSQLPLIGRDTVLAQLQQGDRDVILVGKPGVGKTRVLAQLPDVVFVDPDAAEDRLADDIRWLQPRVIVIDDVGQSPKLARLVQRLRRQEADWLSIRLIVVCWPDEVEGLRELVPGADEIGLDLLERSDIDAIIRAMGITAVMARQQILDQAEGRPGWSVALADLLLRSGWEDLVTGKAILGQIDSYLRRSQMSVSARDLLGVIAALRGVDDTDLSGLAKTVGISRPEAGRLLRVVAQGGVLDVDQSRTRDGLRRRYTVRPPMLADAVSTEHYFLGEVPLGGIDELLKSWPDRHVDVLLTTCTAARLGSEYARSIVDTLVDSVLSGELSPELARAVYEAYALVDERSSGRVIAWLVDEFGRVPDGERADGYRFAPLVELAYISSARYMDRDAVRLLLDIAIFDTRATNPNPEHPLRKLADLCTRVHPDLGPSADHRALVAAVLADWLPDEPSQDQWRVWTAVVLSVLTPHARGSFTAPEDSHKFSVIETIVTSDQARVILEKLWPGIVGRLGSAPDSVTAQFVAVVHEWLRVGGGYDHPFGQDHPQPAMEQADRVGRAMITDLIALSEGKRGLIARIAGTASMFDIELSADLRGEAERDPFFQDFDRFEDWQQEIETLRAAIAREVRAWSGETPSAVVQRLVALRAELSTAGVRWPDRIWIACQALAESVDNPRPWVAESLAQGLFPEASPFVQRLIDGHSDGDRELLEACLRDTAARGNTVGGLLTHAGDEGLRDRAIAELTIRDYGLLNTLVIRGELSEDTQLTILRDASNAARGAFALALLGRRDDPEEAISDALRGEFLKAVSEIQPGELSRTDNYQLLRLVRFLAANHPDTLEELIRKRLEDAGSGRIFQTLGYDMWQAIHVLPHKNKTSLFRRFDAPGVRWFMFEHLVGTDIEWLASLLRMSRTLLKFGDGPLLVQAAC